MPLPPAPQPGSPTFPQDADTFLSALPGFESDMNALEGRVNAKEDAVDTAVSAAMDAGLANAAANAAAANQAKLDAQAAVPLASAQADRSTTQANRAEGEANRAAQAASDAEAAAGVIPPTSGHALQVLRVKADASGVEWAVGGLQHSLRTSNVMLAPTDAGKLVDLQGTFTQTLALAGLNCVPNGNLAFGKAGWTGPAAGWTYMTDAMWGDRFEVAAPNGLYVWESLPFQAAVDDELEIEIDSLLFLGSGSGYVYCDLIFKDAGGAVIFDGPETHHSTNHDYSSTDSNRAVHRTSVTVPTGTVYIVARVVAYATPGVAVLGWRDMRVTSSGRTAEAVLGDGWYAYLRNAGDGRVTVDPSGSELINGSPTLTLYPGNTVLLQCDGVGFRTLPVGGWRRPIFGAAAELPGSILEQVQADDFKPVPGGAGQLRFASNGSTLIAAPNAAIGLVGSTTDGRVFTSRAMPSAAQWLPASDGAGFMAVSVGATGTAYSATGTSWAAATALPANAQVNSTLAGIPGRYIARGAATTTTLYLTTNNGGAWSTETAPIANMNVLTSCAGLFVGRSTGANYYTSATGATGSWTTRTLPGGATSMRQDFDGSLIAWNGSSAWRSTDAINWVALPVTLPAGGVVTINGVYVSGGTGNFWTCHRGAWAQRTYAGQGMDQVVAAVATIAGVYLINRDNTNGQVIVIDTNPGQEVFALFA